jgi:hypothetical protein
MTDNTAELTTKGQTIMRQAFLDARRKEIMKRARKAIRKTPRDSSIVHMRVWSTAEMVLAISCGFQREENLSLGRGAGPQSYLMSISRADLEKALLEEAAA